MSIALAYFGLKLIQTLEFLLLRQRIVKKIFDLADNLLFLSLIKETIFPILLIFFEDLSRFIQAKSACRHNLLIVSVAVSCVGFDMT